MGLRNVCGSPLSGASRLTCRLGGQAATDPDQLPANDVADATRRPTDGNEPLSTNRFASLTATPALYLRVEGMDHQFRFLLSPQ